jgi:hypothetical protein
LGFYANYYEALGLVTQTSHNNTNFSTTLLDLDVGLPYHFRPIRQSAFHLGLFAAFRRADLAVTTGQQNATAGLPAIGIRGLVLGLTSEVPINTRLYVDVDLPCVLPIMNGQIFRPTYYKGSSYGLDGTLGLGVHILQWLFVKADVVLRAIASR